MKPPAGRIRPRHIGLLAIVAVIAVVRVAATHRVFSPTYDEPLHLTCGYEYLAEHRYSTDLEHPPIARAVEALPFVHRPHPAGTNWVEQGNNLLDEGGHYLRGIADARRGNLLFLVLGIIGVAGWAYQRFGATTAVVAAALFTTLPPVLAHAGLATTDMAGAAALPLALWMFDWWLQNPTWIATVAAGLTTALGLLTKFSFAAFFFASAIALCVAARRLPLAKALAALLVAALLVWAVYFGAFGTMTGAHAGLQGVSLRVFGSSWVADHVPVPAPLFVGGLLTLKMDDQIGRDSFLLGRHSHHGWWFYFPVVLAVKTPLPFLLFALVGVLLAVQAPPLRPLVAVSAIVLAIGMTSHINVGVRHILPIYGPLSIVAAEGAIFLSLKLRWVPGMLALWLVADGVLAHPDYLSWMNAAAGSHPERVLADSNLDWGQDLIRLRRECRRNHIDDLGALVFTRADFARLGLPKLHFIDAHVPAPGWYAVSETEIALWDGYDPTAYKWLTSRADFTRVGTTIRLYHVGPKMLRRPGERTSTSAVAGSDPTTTFTSSRAMLAPRGRRASAGEDVRSPAGTSFPRDRV